MMTGATTSSSGQCLTQGPLDVCKTPSPGGPVPLPYPNIGMCSDGDGSSKVKVKGKNALRKGDTLSKSAGDEAGSIGGVKSSRIKGDVVFKLGDSRIKVEGKEWSHHMALTQQNAGNTVGSNMVPC
jgi:uncharacterized Zn-binding protein involved in type VI secretion